MEEIINLLYNPAVIWFLIGLAFLVFEFFIPGLIILFFGVGCWVTSLLVLIVPEVSLNVQLSTFIISSILSLVLLRKSLKNWINKSERTKNESLEEYVGKHCVAETDFVDGIGGKVSFKGALWKAHSDSKIKKGDAVIIKSVDSIHLIVEPV